MAAREMKQRLGTEAPDGVSVFREVRVWQCADGLVEVWLVYGDALGDRWGMVQVPTHGRTWRSVWHEVEQRLMEHAIGPFDGDVLP